MLLAALAGGTARNLDHDPHQLQLLHLEQLPGLALRHILVRNSSLTQNRLGDWGQSPLARASERAIDPIQAFCKHFRVYAHANTKMIRHFEKTTRNR